MVLVQAFVRFVMSTQYLHVSCIRVSNDKELSMCYYMADFLSSYIQTLLRRSVIAR